MGLHVFHMNKVLFLKGNQNSDVKEAVRTRRTPTPTPKSYGTWEGKPSTPERTSRDKEQSGSAQVSSRA